jgi:hypothetical protein
MKTCPSCGLVFPDESTFCFLSGDTLEPAADSLIGTTLAGRFRIEGQISQGARAKIYRARHRMLDRRCVVKVLIGAIDVQRFTHAVAMARRCTHPNVAELVGGGFTDDGTAYVVHPELPGAPLTQTIAQGPMAPGQALGIALQLLSAVARIHDFGATHGNIRPSNIIISNGGHIDVVDVGLGRTLTRDPWDADPESLRAQRYFAPELSSQQRASASADRYSVGVIIYELLSGAVPYDAANVAELRNQNNEGGTMDLSLNLDTIPDPMRLWLASMLSRILVRRPANAPDAYEALQELLAVGDIKAMPDPGRGGSEAAIQQDPGFERWQRYGGVFNKMVELGFPNGAPDLTRGGLQEIVGRVGQLAELGQKGLFEHNGIGEILDRARVGRKNIADQMDTLHDDAKDVRKELRPLKIAAERHGEKAVGFPAQALELHKEVVRWEGRSGFTEPYKELADAYRAMGEIIEKWWSVRSAQLACERDAADKDEIIVGVNAKLDELREALRVHESNLEAEIATCEAKLAQLGASADKLEAELLDLASRFSAPLRSKPELGACFRDLAKV